MSKHKLIPYPVIAAAVRGDREAVNRVLDFYSGYIAALSTRRGYDQNGNPCLAVDEEIRRRIETTVVRSDQYSADMRGNKSYKSYRPQKTHDYRSYKRRQ